MQAMPHATEGGVAYGAPSIEGCDQFGPLQSGGPLRSDGRMLATLRRVASIIAAAMTSLPFITGALAQSNSSDYPSRPIRLIVPFPAGGINDVIARSWAEGVRTALGGVIVIENKGGAGGVPAAKEVSRANPDGYTLLLGNTTTQIVHPMLMHQPPYDPVKDFETIAILTMVPNAFAVSSGLGVKTLGELVAYAHANPGKLSYGSAGVGTLTHIAAEMLKKMAKADIVHVPYRGVAPGMTDLVAGHIPMFSASMAAQLLELHRTGKIRILAVNSSERLELAPEIPTAAESGYPDLVAVSINGLFAPAGTPVDILEKLAAATAKALQDPMVRNTLRGTGGQIITLPNVAAARELVRTEQEHWRPLIDSMPGVFQ